MQKKSQDSKKKAPSKKPSIVVGIGASAGGTPALKQFFSSVEDSNSISYIVARHTDEAGNSLSQSVLQSFTSLPVTEIDDGMTIKPKTVYLAPAHSLVSIEENQFKVEYAHSRELSRTVIDYLFRHLATAFKVHAVGVILSGEGSDGAQGLKAISDEGGMTIAQDPDTAPSSAMPHAAISTGIVDHVLKLQDIPHELKTYVAYVEKMVDGKAMHTLRDEIGHALNNICEILHKVTHHDFKHYKTTTLIRRIQRRMQVLQLSSVDAYLQRLADHPSEVDSLFKELLINVTSFFRDPEAFEYLRENVVAPGLSKIGMNQKFRVWIAGCSSGEEAYTMAMVIREELDNLKRPVEVQIIATDIDEHALSQARKGSYPLSIAEYLPPDRLQRFFQKRGGRYHIQKEVREMVLFSAHNLINDPPFSQLDLISCRNVLIYLGLHLQKKLIPVFHYALKTGGHLFLGTSESLSTHKELFKSVSAKYRIAQRKATAIRPLNTTFSSTMSQNFTSHAQEAQRNHEADVHLVSQRIVLDEFSSRYAVVNDDLQIISVSGGIQSYLEPSEGTFQNHIVKLVKPSLRVSLRMALKEAQKHKRRTDVETATLKFEDGIRRVGITVQPMPQLGDESGLFMVVFHRLGRVDIDVKVTTEISSDVRDSGALVDQLEKELTLMREDLDKTVQDLEASNEELKSSNEELLSMNEELQSANEELEASKEEVQTTNEALHRSNSDLENLLASTQIATLFLDEDFSIKNFTPAISEIYRVRESDIGRDIRDFSSHAFNMPAYPEASSLVGENTFSEIELLADTGKVYLRRIHPYYTHKSTIDGLVVSFIDITELRRSEERLRILADSVPVITWTTKADGNNNFFNARWYEYTGQRIQDSANWGWIDYLHPDDIPMTRQLWMDSIVKSSDFHTEYRIRRSDGTYRWHQVHGIPYQDNKGQVLQWFGTCVDIQDKKEEYQIFERNIDSVPAKIWMTETDGSCSYLSHKWYRLTGQHRADALGFGWWDAFHPDDKSLVQEVFFNANRDQKSFSEEARVLNSKGEYLWTMVSANPRYSQSGIYQGMAGMVLNIHDRKDAEGRLEESRQSIDTMFHTSPSFMALLTGQEYIFEEANEQYMQLVGRRDLIGRRVVDALPEIRGQGFFELLEQVRRTGIPQKQTESPVYLKRQGGGKLERRYIDFVYQKHTSSREGVDRIFVHGNDVTEKVLSRQAIENERANFRNLFKQTPEMVCILSGPEHIFEFVNDAHVKALGFNATGMKVREAQPESVEVHGLLDSVYNTGITHELKELPVTLTDRVRYFNLTYAPRFDVEGRISGVMILGMEITEEVLSRSELKKSKEEADKANQSKTTFLANVSHEIRTPLGAILGFADLLSMEHSPSTEASDFIDRIGKNARQLGRLIDELLDLSKIEANRLEIERIPVELNSLIDDVISSVRPQATEKNLQLTVEKKGQLPAKVMTDPTRLKQILTNLAGNAVKFTEHGGVSISIEVVQTEDQNHLCARVTDTGIGLSEDQVSRLFKPFAQGDASITRKFGGTGLGLVLSQQLSRLLGGDLTLERSALDEGATFLLKIAIGTPQELEHYEAHHKPSKAIRVDDYNLKGRKILIVDDAPDNQALVRRYLNRVSAQHDSAMDGEEAIHKAMNGDFDVVLMDLQMPKVDGHTAVQELRSRGYTKPIIALTAHALKGEREKCLEVGFNEYITKPIEKGILLKTLNDLLK